VVTCSTPGVEAAAWQDRGAILVLAVNTGNTPHPLRLTVRDVDSSGQAEVLFENRSVVVTAGAIEDMIDAFGTRAYQIRVGPPLEERLEVHPRNLIVNPSFESNPSPGTPAGCYAEVGSGRGATYFVEPRVACHGRHSVRLVAPSDEQQMLLSPYAPRVIPGKSYRLSVWAKALPGSERPTLGISAPVLGEASFPLTTEWREYEVIGAAEEGSRRAWITVGLVSRGAAYIDLLQFADISPVIQADAPIFVEPMEVSVQSYEKDVALRVTVDGTDPTTTSPFYTGPMTLTATTTVKAAAFRGDTLLGDVVEAAFTQAEYREPARVDGLKPGLHYSYYEGKWEGLPDFDALEPVERGIATGFDISLRRGEDEFAFRFHGYLSVARDGVYTFATRSDDGSTLYIGERKVVDNDGLHGARERSAPIALRAGLHPIRVEFFERDGAEQLRVHYEGPGLPRRPMPPSVLWHLDR
jgi:hypothetical protein